MNDPSPVVNVVSWGRSNQSIINHHTRYHHILHIPQSITTNINHSHIPKPREINFIQFIQTIITNYQILNSIRYIIQTINRNNHIILQTKKVRKQRSIYSFISFIHHSLSLSICISWKHNWYQVLVSLEYLYYETRIIILFNSILSTFHNDFFPIPNEVSLGRSNQLIIYHHTIQTQTYCFIEWFISCNECSEIRKIKSINRISSYFLNSKMLEY